MLIAEIGNNHFGNFEKAQEMILRARNVGADAVKLQAFRASDIKGGSMPPEFYAQCEFSFAQYKELIDLGEALGVPVFYSIFSDEFRGLLNYQKFRKYSGKQTVAALEKKEFIDYKNTFASFPESHISAAAELDNARPLYVTPYLPVDPRLYYLDYLAKLARGPYGYSDHTIGIRACELAAKKFGARIIEKHFTLDKDVSFNGVIFRDTVHAADEPEFYRLKKLMEVI